MSNVRTHMRKCPHCGKPGLGLVEWSLASAGGPARCAQCGGLSLPHPIYRGLIDASAQLAFYVAIAFALYYWSGLPLVALAVFLVAATVGIRLLPARPTTAARAKRVRWLQVGVFATFVLSAAGWLLFERGAASSAACSPKALSAESYATARKSCRVSSNPSIERTFQRPLRALWPAAHVER
jgi:hypothetical protein